MREHKPRATLVWLLLFFGFIVRLAPVGRYVTPDEPAWVYRSARFHDALISRDWALVPSTGHPGVTTMWLGAAGVAVRRLLDLAESDAHLDWIRRLVWLAPENGEAFRHLAFFLTPGRVAVALVATLGLLLTYILASRAFDCRVALLATGLLAFDPFLVGHSGLLHTDALLATFGLLALLSAFNGLRKSRQVLWWALSGFFAGLALLTKLPAFILLPFLFFLLLASRLLPSAPRSFRSLLYGSLLALSTAAVIFALYPALWVGPADVLQTMVGFAGRHMEMAQRSVFFLGRTTHDPGPAFYPVVLFVRLSPLILVGLVRGLVRLRYLPADRRFFFLALLVFAIFFGAMLTLGAKKHDRYLLPVFPPLALAAALSLSDVRGPKVSCTFLSLSPRLLLIALQLFLLLPFVAHPLTYANPMLGGPIIGARLISLDWGEGMGAAARWLNQLPEADRLTVAALNVPSFASLFVGRTFPLNDVTISLADYVVSFPSSHPVARLPSYPVSITLLPHAVVYTNTAPLEQARYLAAHVRPGDLILLDADAPLLRKYDGPGEIASVARLPDEVTLAAWLAERVPDGGGLWMVHFPGASPITTAHLRRQVESIATTVVTATIASATITQHATSAERMADCNQQRAFLAVFDGQLILVDGVIPEAAAWPDSLAVALRWRALASPPIDYRAAVTLRGPDGHIWSSADRLILNGVFFPTSAWSPDEWVDVVYELPLPPSIPPARYAVEVALYDSTTGIGVGSAGPEGRFLGTRVVVGEMTVMPPMVPTRSAVVKVPRRLDLLAGPLTLLGMDLLPAQVLSGDRFSLALVWQADSAPEEDYQVRLRLAREGRVGVEMTVPLSSYPTSSWRAGDRFESRYTLHVLPELPSGSYQVVLNVLDEKGYPLWEGDQILGRVEILPRERSFELPEDIPYPLALTFGGKIHLLGYRLDRTSAVQGDVLPLTLYWRADGPTERSYTLFVHLLGPEGLPYGQVDRIPGNGSSPTSSWAAGQVIVEEIALPVAADAPPGVYHIAVGYYDAAYGGRLSVTDPSGRHLPDDQAILPTTITLPGGPQ
ncbi:MAG TPA: glycosyltransferase family 39 protein [Anaerolineae bacterium]|nr:glycosyltransferase family 39 protein [Anaerolineae bacterium]